jgi:hypothetical protein
MRAQARACSLGLVAWCLVGLGDGSEVHHPKWWIAAPYIHMLFITLGDGRISPSPRPTNQPSNRATQTNWPNHASVCRSNVMRVRVSVEAHVPVHRLEPPRVPLLEPISSVRPDWADDAPIKPIDPASTHPHVTQSCLRCPSVIRLYCQRFCCNELNHFTSLNSAILL